MNTLKNILVAAFVASATLASTSLLAQPATQTGDMKGMGMSSGEVKKIDKQAQKITLKHGEIKNLDMPGMTMVFRVLEPALLDSIQVGDKVKFSAEKRDGAIVITAIEAIR